MTTAARNRINVYTCMMCGRSVVTEDVAEGVTPVYLGCRATPGCQGTMQSHFYRVLQTLRPTWEWYRPDSLDGLTPQSRQHVQDGGLLCRPKVIL